MTSKLIIFLLDILKYIDFLAILMKDSFSGALVSSFLSLSQLFQGEHVPLIRMQSHIKLNVCSIDNGRSAPGAYPGEGRYSEIGTPHVIFKRTHAAADVSDAARHGTRRAGLVTLV